MSAGLVVGIIVAVIALCVAVSLATRKWTTRKILRDRRRTTQIYVLPPPVQARSAGSTDSIRAETPFLSSTAENSLARPRSLSDAVSVRSYGSARYSADLTRDIAELPAFNSLPNSPATEATPSVPFTPVAPSATGTENRASMSFAHVPSRTPGITKAKTFRSEVIEIGRSRASSLGSSTLSPWTPGDQYVPSMPPMPEAYSTAKSQTASISDVTRSPPTLSPANSVPRQRARARTASSVSSLGATEVSSLTGGIVSPATATFSITETPTALAPAIGTHDPRALLRPDDAIPPVPVIPSLAPVEPMYIPYRATPSG